MDQSLLTIIGIPIAAVIGLMLSVLNERFVRRIMKSKACAIDDTSSDMSYLAFLPASLTLSVSLGVVCTSCFGPFSLVALFISYGIDLFIIIPQRIDRRYIIEHIQSVVEDTMHVDPKEAKKSPEGFIMTPSKNGSKAGLATSVSLYQISFSTNMPRAKERIIKTSTPSISRGF